MSGQLSLHDDVMPDRLRRFNPADWEGGELPAEWPPGWNADKSDAEKAHIWLTIDRRSEWINARLRWLHDHGISAADVLEARHRREDGQLRERDEVILQRLGFSLTPGVPFWRPQDWIGVDD